MEKIQQLIQNIIEKIKRLIETITNNSNDMKQLQDGNYHIYQGENQRILENNEIVREIHLDDNVKAIFTNIPGMELPIGAFEIEGNNVILKEPMTIGEDGKLYMRGIRVYPNDELNDEIIRQYKQNGRFRVCIDRSTGEIIKTDSEKYREEMYDEEARKKTEKVSKEWRENKEQTRDAEREKNEEENEKNTETEQQDR